MSVIAGLLLFLAGSVILMGIETAEILYPERYSISLNMISTLGSTPPPSGIVYQPSAAIFDLSLLVGGIFIFTASVLLYKKKVRTLVIIPFVIMGISASGAGLFPAKTGGIHLLFALLLFLFGGISALTSSSITRIPFAYLSILLGLVTILFLFLGLFGPSVILPVLGPGGTERWIAYPLIIWLLGYGSYLMARK